MLAFSSHLTRTSMSYSYVLLTFLREIQNASVYVTKMWFDFGFLFACFCFKFWTMPHWCSRKRNYISCVRHYFPCNESVLVCTPTNPAFRSAKSGPGICTVNEPTGTRYGSKCLEKTLSTIASLKQCTGHAVSVRGKKKAFTESDHT